MSFRKRTCSADENDEGTTQKGVPEAMSQNGFKLEGHCCSAAEDWSQAQGKAHAPVEKKSNQLRRSGDWAGIGIALFAILFLTAPKHESEDSDKEHASGKATNAAGLRTPFLHE